MEPVIGQGAPEVWSLTVREADSPGLLDAMAPLGPVRLADLARDPADRGRRIAACRCCSSATASAGRCLPADTEIRPGDELLFAGRERARLAMHETMLNANTAEYVLTGRDRPSSVLARLIDRLHPTRPAVG